MFSIEELKKEKNIATKLDDDKLQEIGQQVKSRYETDLASLGDRHMNRKQAIDLAMQIMEVKSEPWDKAANVKLPLIARAVINYSSRAFPEIINRNNLVKCMTQGNDPESFKFKRGLRVCKTINYQNCYESNNWKKDTDKLLTLVAVLGTVFRRSSFDKKTQKMETELCLPTNVIVNGGVSNIQDYPLTHLFERNKNHIITEYRRSNYIIPKRYVDKFKTKKEQLEEVQKSVQKLIKEDTVAVDFNIEMGQQQCWIDLDEDGYAEPYLVTFDINTGEVFRVVNRFKNIEKDEKGAVVEIEAENYYNDYHFLPSFDGNFYSIGFGEFLLPLNHAINTTASHLLNTANLANNPPTIISSGLIFEEGIYQFGPGKCMRARYNAEAGSIADSIYTFPKNEPSAVLYQLLTFLTNMCNDLTSITDVMQGKQPLQNVARDNYAQAVEQGSKVFTAINMRIIDEGFGGEYRRQYGLNGRFLDNAKYLKILDDPAANKAQDFEMDAMDIYPVADPQFSTSEQRLSRIQVMRSAPTHNPYEVDKYLYTSIGLDDTEIEKMLQAPDPNAPPPADEMKKAAEAKLAEARVGELAAKMTLEAERVQMLRIKLEEELKLMEAQRGNYQALMVKAMKDAANNEAKTVITATKMRDEQDRKADEFIHKTRMDKANLGLQAVDKENDRVKLMLEEQKVQNDKEKNDSQKVKGESNATKD